MRRRRAALLAVLALSGGAHAAADPALVWLRGVLREVTAGQVTRALGAFDPHFQTPEWRGRLQALRGLQVLRLAPQGGAGQYLLTYRVPQGSLNLSGTVAITVTPQPGAPAWVISTWTVLPARQGAQLSVSPGPVTPGAALEVRGSGFPPRTPVEVRLGAPGSGGALLGRVQASRDGSFTLSARVPDDLSSAPPDATALQLSADGSTGPHLRLTLPFRPPSAVTDLSGRYQGAGFALRYPAAYRVVQNPDSVTLIAPGGQVALRATLTPRAWGTDDLSAQVYAEQFAALHPDLLPTPVTPPASLGPELFGWTAPLLGDRVAVLLPDSALAERWVVLVAEPGFAPLLLPVAHAVTFVAPPPQDDVSAP